MLPSQSHPSPGRTHQHYGPYCPLPGPPTALTPMTYPMVKTIIQKMQAQQKPMHVIMLIQATRTTTTPIDIPCTKMGFSKWGSKVAFGVYRSWFDVFVANTFLSLTGNISTDPGCDNSSQSLFSLLVVHILSKIVEAFTDNPYMCRRK